MVKMTKAEQNRAKLSFEKQMWDAACAIEAAIKEN